MSQPTLLFHGGRIEPHPVELSSLVADLRRQLPFLHDQPIHHLLDLVNALVGAWSTPAMRKQYPYLKNISDFLSRKNLETHLAIALHGSVETLDAFQALGDSPLRYHAQPRGLTVQWLAGNVSVLGLFSIFSAILTKNVCLIKASSHGYQELIQLLDQLTTVRTPELDGQQLAQAIAVVLVDSDDRASHELLSRAADVRIAWGGHDAINTIMQLPKGLYTEDLVFGPKYSYALIDHESLAKNQTGLAQRLAIDISVFDQYACSSPHTVFIEEQTPGTALAFAEELARQLDFVNRTLIPKGPIDTDKAMEIVQLRTEYASNGKVFASKGTEWTVLYSTDPGLATGCFSRVIVVKPVNDLATLGGLNDRQKQTMAVALTDEHKRQYLDQITRAGIDRCPDLGYATFYESPWDGMFVFDRLVRWVTTSFHE